MNGVAWAFEVIAVNPDILGVLQGDVGLQSVGRGDQRPGRAGAAVVRQLQLPQPLDFGLSELDRKLGLPLLFLEHLLAHMRPVEEGGGRIAFISDGSALFTGKETSGESAIRRWLFEHDLLEAVIALPEELFYNAGIGTYIWLISNNKEPRITLRPCRPATTNFRSRKMICFSRSVKRNNPVRHITVARTAGRCSTSQIRKNHNCQFSRAI